MIKKAVIDFSAFVGFDKAVIVKELTIVDVDSLAVQHWVFKPPTEKQQQQKKESHEFAVVSHRYEVPFFGHNEWLSKHFHGLSYESGSTEYESLQQALRHYCCGVQLLYAPSDEKAKELEKILDEQRAVISLESLGCPPLPRETLTPDWGEGGEDRLRNKQCLLHRMHSPGFYCTQSNAMRLVDWCRANDALLDMNKSENRLKTFNGAHWKLTIPSPHTLAELGFVRLLSTPDTAKCVYCGLCLHQWQEGDNAAEDHEYNSPFCTFLRFRHQQLRKAKYGEEEKGDVVGSRVISEDVLFASCNA